MLLKSSHGKVCSTFHLFLGYNLFVWEFHRERWISRKRGWDSQELFLPQFALTYFLFILRSANSIFFLFFFLSSSFTSSDLFLFFEPFLLCITSPTTLFCFPSPHTPIRISLKEYPPPFPALSSYFSFISGFFLKLSFLPLKWGNICIVANVLVYDIVVSEFELQSLYLYFLLD